MVTSTAPTGSVTSHDGTSIAYWRSGSGPPLVVVHGTTSDHSTFNELLPHAASRRTVYIYDRRGRGQSGDGPPGTTYTIDLETADAAAVIDEVAHREQRDVDVLAHSFGAFVALGAMSRTSQVRALAVYSPGFGAEYAPGSLDRVESAVASDDLDTALQVIFREIIGMPDEEIAVLRSSPVWAVRTEVAWSVARECRADQAFLATHGPRLKELALPVLVISGETNTREKRQIASTLADLLPNARLVDLPGEGHAAHHTAPEALLKAALTFFDQVR